jgi:MFS family permease
VRARHVLLAVAAGLALADASIVTLALPELLFDLKTTVEGVAAVIGVYTVVLAAALLPAERLMRRLGPARLGAAGLLVFGGASLVAGLSGTLTVLLLARAVQAAGGAAGLVAVFTLLVHREGAQRSARGLWLGAAVLSAAVGPALGGALTQAFSWHAIFLFQAPVAAIAAAVCFGTVWTPPAATAAADAAADEPAPSFEAPPAAALALVSAALTAVLFLLVLLLVAGWAVTPLRAALTVTIVPAGALVGSRLGGPARARAAVGCLLVALGTFALAFLPDPHLAWTFAPQALAGLGMGLALPSLGGELLPERDAHDAARLLTVRHVGIAVALAILAPITANRLDSTTRDAEQRGIGLVLDSKLDPLVKLRIAPKLLDGVNSESPRGGLRTAAAAQRASVPAAERPEYDRLISRLDDAVIVAIGDSFLPAFLITCLFALLAGLAVALERRTRDRRTPAWGLAILLAGILALAGQAVAWQQIKPAKHKLADPCHPGPPPSAGGPTGALQAQLLTFVDAAACKFGSSREALVLALLDPSQTKRYAEQYHVDPRALAGLVKLLGKLVG